MKKYAAPDIQLLALTKQDVLAASDVLIDGSDLFGTEEN